MSDLKTVLINDSRIEDISGELSFKVEGGAQYNTFQPQQANTASNNSHSWSINPPSQNIVVSRRMLIDTDVRFIINISNVPPPSAGVSGVAFDWGNTDGFGPYPLTSCYLTQTALINNMSLSVSTQDLMAPLLRMNEQIMHTNYDGWTPSLVDDVYFNYSDGVGANNNPLSAMDTEGLDNKFRGRGAHPVSIVVDHKIGGVSVDSSVISTSITDTWVITVQTHLTEPLLFLSPFLSDPATNNQAGFLGINNFGFNFTIDSDLRRVFRTSNNYTYKYSLATDYSNSSGFSGLQMLVNYLSVQPSQYAKISAKNILPLLQYDRYIVNSNNAGALLGNTGVNLVSSNIALNQIPDTIIIFVRPRMSSQTAKNSDSFFAIKKVSINFNNVSGILASCSVQELWELSQKAGSSQSYLEFLGKCNTSSANGRGSTIPTTGSLLVLQPAFSFNLPEYLSASSLGSYNLQFSVDIENQSSSTYTPELVVITINSGYMTTNNGTSSAFSGVLNKEMVMSAKDGSAVPRLSQSDYERLVGGSLRNRGVANMMKQFKGRRGMSGPASDMSGGVMSGGIPSGGRLNKYIK
jgi:hypothetical protein